MGKTEEITELESRIRLLQDELKGLKNTLAENHKWRFLDYSTLNEFTYNGCVEKIMSALRNIVVCVHALEIHKRTEGSVYVSVANVPAKTSDLNADQIHFSNIMLQELIEVFKKYAKRTLDGKQVLIWNPAIGKEELGEFWENEAE